MSSVKENSCKSVIFDQFIFGDPSKFMELMLSMKNLETACKPLVFRFSPRLDTAGVMMPNDEISDGLVQEMFEAVKLNFRQTSDPRIGFSSGHREKTLPRSGGTGSRRMEFHNVRISPRAFVELVRATREHYDDNRHSFEYEFQIDSEGNLQNAAIIFQRYFGYTYSSLENDSCKFFEEEAEEYPSLLSLVQCENAVVVIVP